MKTPILGGSYIASSVNAADNVMINLYPESVPEGGKEPAFLRRAPGLKEVNGVGIGPIHGMYSMTEADGTKWLFVASGGTLYYTTNIGSGFTSAGGLVGGFTVPCYFSDNGTQVFISVPAGSSYIFDVGTTSLTSINATDADFPGASTVTYMDGYFVVTKPDSDLVYVSALLDGLSWDPLAFASAERSPDGVIAVIANNQELWVMGRNSTEVWYDTGSAGFPFAPIQGVFNEVGCLAALSVVKVDNSIYWLGRNNYGQAIVYRSNGYQAERISTYAIEYDIQQRIATNSGFDAEATFCYVYQQEGHTFYVMNFPVGSPNGYLTWVYDVTTGVWHRRAGWDGSAFVSTRAFCTAFQFNRQYVGDYSTDQMYYFDTTYYKEGSTEQRWLRSWRALAPGMNNLKRTAHHSLQLDIETGGNASSMGTTEANVSLRWSDDGGHTWSTARTASMGAAADYSKRVIWRRLGMTMKLRDRVYEVSGTDPVKIAIMGAELIMSPTDA